MTSTAKRKWVQGEVLPSELGGPPMLRMAHVPEHSPTAGAAVK